VTAAPIVNRHSSIIHHQANISFTRNLAQVRSIPQGRGVSMPTYTASQIISAPANEVFAFVSDISRMPEYLPTVHQARPQGHNRVEMEGNAAGHEYKSDGWLEADEKIHTMRWGSDGESDYSGHLEVQNRGEDSFVTVTLNFNPPAEMDHEFQRRMGSRDAAIKEGLQKALHSIKNVCEGTGVKVRTFADQKGYVG
jgi:uncharacterized membrane protein